MSEAKIAGDPRCGIRLFAPDIDDTVLGEPTSPAFFKQAWESIEAEHRPLLVYNTRRGMEDVKWLVLEGRIPAPEFIIGGIGTEVFDPVDARVSPAFRAHIGAGWDRDAVHHIVESAPGVRQQSDELLKEYKLSWRWPHATADDIERLKLRLVAAGLPVSLHYTSDGFLDVIPACAGKGSALSWLCSRIGIDTATVLVAGARGNNSSMFHLPGVRGILVGNGSRELAAAAEPCRPFIASAPSAHGVIAGLRHFGVLPAVSEGAVTASRADG